MCQQAVANNAAALALNRALGFPQVAYVHNDLIRPRVRAIARTAPNVTPDLTWVSAALPAVRISGTPAQGLPAKYYFAGPHGRGDGKVRFCRQRGGCAALHAATNAPAAAPTVAASCPGL